MSQTMSNPSATTDESAGPRGFVTGQTEARPALFTTEFWVAMAAGWICVIAAYVDDGIADRLGWILYAGITVAYILSRGLAKAGSYEGPFGFRVGGGPDGSS